MRAVVTALAWGARVLLAAFFGFVGYWKARGPLEMLAEHRAWVAGFPAGFARVVGWSEILLGLLLLAVASPRLRPAAGWAAVLLLINQVFAAWVHAARREFDALPQNAVIIALLALIITSHYPRKAQ